MEEIIQRAILVGVDLNNDKNFDYSVEELKNLAEACSVEVADVLTQKLERVNSAHYIGSGKVEEVAHLVAKNDANLVIFNDELSPSQIRNLEHELQCKVIDRTILILDIFASRAKTREAQLQVEVAQLKYMMPRLIGLNASLSRQAGGIGSKGPGEKKLELDRRRIEEQIHKLNKELDALVLARQNQRKLRKKNATPVVALVGYTNAGKSTTMNALLNVSNAEADKSVFEKNMLFATLETSTRQIQLPDNKQFLLTDTVGFVSKLPHQLVKAFRSTLEEVTEADLLLHVVDLSHPEFQAQIEITNKVLDELGVKETPMVYVYNKADLVDNEFTPSTQEAVRISAKNLTNIDTLINSIKSHLFHHYVKETFLIPYDKGNIISYLNDHATVFETEYLDNGTLITVECSDQDVERFHQYKKSSLL
ncbi:MAG: GTPase HflX [Turicibacter sp.]|uniref:GTPase HflX n=1 Tax=Turicibacter faecis TaxID=2963365 RepID=A0ABN6Z7W0_9FIRM|nr:MULTISPECIES: GTPase HflX [unclassified Turicibacter]MCI8701086.1 GTPase HflX [Turicibacter sp.]BEH89927.1 GTPase HflX [Turicibacter sp. TC023]MCU7203666.1 GTPase HflX [Turicibacter sp. TA25]MCU7208981.1 GTPase HflX [Turicibacter sp. 1E2]NCE79166.1 GTPase HflX [Turicibacter sp. TS3]